MSLQSLSGNTTILEFKDNNGNIVGTIQNSGIATFSGITLSPSIDGIIKSSGGTLTGATHGVDYISPLDFATGNDVTGGTDNLKYVTAKAIRDAGIYPSIVSTPYNESFVATSGQTAFTLSNTPSAIWLWLNGLLQEATTWSVTNNDVILSSPATSGDTIEVYYLSVAAVMGKATTSDVMAGIDDSKYVTSKAMYDLITLNWAAL